MHGCKKYVGLVETKNEMKKKCPAFVRNSVSGSVSGLERNRKSSALKGVDAAVQSGDL